MYENYHMHEYIHSLMMPSWYFSDLSFGASVDRKFWKTRAVILDVNFIINLIVSFESIWFFLLSLIHSIKFKFVVLLFSIFLWSLYSIWTSFYRWIIELLLKFFFSQIPLIKLIITVLIFLIAFLKILFFCILYIS